MQVDFYHLTRDPLGGALALIAGKATAGGERMVVVSGDAAQRKALSQALWSASPTSFLANGEADEPHAERQPIVLSDQPVAVNGARFLAIVDNVWRDGEEAFARTFFFFEDHDRDAARAAWAMLGKREGVVRNYWKQDGGRWVRAG
ncbi:DNA polymerase III subunit chi [Novosphingobium colocasiae]|uniref:DNA polymerase III subunit chi n=1 Tax=Novosphingobium colocasiae TaxID=1256513 RepID=A0A918PE99_9SPHN|nr:DNA polymerase III subunit chi [Novosphingobium colocasiae]GGZ01722.1 DNA polymerase III subunit chi [Novosphingobium colocasiae]